MTEWPVPLTVFGPLARERNRRRGDLTVRKEERIMVESESLQGRNRRRFLRPVLGGDFLPLCEKLHIPARQGRIHRKSGGKVLDHNRQAGIAE